MSLISASNLAKSYGPNDIFSEVSLSIPRRARIALVGANGVGKTTLLRILVGLEEPSLGNIQRARHVKIGFLAQETHLTGDHTLWEECLHAMSDLRAKEAELIRMEAAMSDPNQVKEVLERYGILQETFERLGGYIYESRIKQVLSGLGFKPKDFQRPIQQLSGGQRTRAMLARLLLTNPDVLILDEPTNHLDISAIEWLESYLQQWKGAALIVSHDRYFLDNVVDHIWELSRDGLETYRGNYSAYLQQRQERWELRQRIFIAEKERLEKELDYIRRNIAGQNTIQAKGRLKRLSRYLEAVEKSGFQEILGKKWSVISAESGASSQMMSLDEVTQRVRELHNPLPRPPRLNLKLRAKQRSGDLVLRTYNLAIGYPDRDHPLFRTPDLVLRRGECAALMGANGTGKTTFLKTIIGNIPPFEGEVHLGASLDVAYFMQGHEDLNPEHNLIEEIELVAPHMLEAEIRDYLARFLFGGETVYKPVSTLSSGERGRLSLAKMCLVQANFLLLDEPTNHLDIPSQEILQEVLNGFTGTILLVSHDRYLIEALATQVWEIQPETEYLHVFQGIYSQYRAWKESERATRLTDKSKQPSAEQPLRPRTVSQQKRHARLKEIEGEIALLEGQLFELAKQLESPPPNPEEVARIGENYVELQNKINFLICLLYTSPSPRDRTRSRMPSSA